jgi:uncharacterized membrane protein YeaQ/YmgE (transglycosylase-associated protein family)
MLERCAEILNEEVERRVKRLQTLLEPAVMLIIGGIVGWLASMVMKTNAQMGLVANVLVGVVGSALGFWSFGLLGLAPSGGILRFVVAIIGAALLIFILQKVGLFKKAP